MLNAPAPVDLPTKSWPVFLASTSEKRLVTEADPDLLDDESDVLVPRKIDGHLYLLHICSVYHIDWEPALSAVAVGSQSQITGISLRPRGEHGQGVVDIEAPSPRIPSSSPTAPTTAARARRSPPR